MTAATVLCSVSGRLFHLLGPTTENELSPTVTSRDRGMSQCQPTILAESDFNFGDLIICRLLRQLYRFSLRTLISFTGINFHQAATDLCPHLFNGYIGEGRREKGKRNFALTFLFKFSLIISSTWFQYLRSQLMVTTVQLDLLLRNVVLKTLCNGSECRQQICSIRINVAHISYSAVVAE